MKNIQSLCILVILFIIVSCNKKDSTPAPNLFAGSMTEFFSDNEQQFQTFTFNSSAGISFTGAKGLQFTFPANSFVDVNGQMISGNINIKLREYVKKSDFIYDRLFTVSGGRPIESAGAYEIKATKNGIELKMATGKSYNVVMTHSMSTPMYVYNGSTLNAQFGKVDWAINTSANNLVVSQPFDSINYQNYLETTGLNIINCDHPYDSLFVPLFGTIPTSEGDPFVIVVDKFRNMVVGLNSNGNDFFWSYAPINTDLIIVSMYKNNSSYYVSTMDVFFTGQLIAMPAYQQKTESEVNDLIENL